MRKVNMCAAFLSLLLSLFPTAPANAANRRELERNKAVVRRLFEEVVCQSKWDVFEEMHTKNFVAHAGKRTATLAEDLAAAKGWLQAFPDATCAVDQIFSEGNLVAVRWTGRGTNTGSGNGLPATGKPAVTSGITIYRVEHGKLAEEWGLLDMWGLLRQLGLAPTLK